MGLLSLLFSNPLIFLIIAGIIVLAITIHEFAHAWTADKLGDPTPRYQGRVTLNPLAHLDPFGTLLLFLVGFGWGKPVQFDPYNLKEPTRDAAIIALAGPVSNLVMALLLALLIPVLTSLLNLPVTLMGTILSLGIFYNCMLAIFNLIPIHPLDGGKIVVALLPRTTAIEYEQLMARFGTFILFALIFPWGGMSPASRLISPIIEFVVAYYQQLAEYVFKLV